MARSDIPSVSYCCRECLHDFGDPEGERDFEAWAMAVKAHAFDCHGKAPYYLGDALTPVWNSHPTHFMHFAGEL